MLHESEQPVWCADTPIKVSGSFVRVNFLPFRAKVSFAHLRKGPRCRRNHSLVKRTCQIEIKRAKFYPVYSLALARRIRQRGGVVEVPVVITVVKCSKYSGPGASQTHRLHSRSNGRGRRAPPREAHEHIDNQKKRVNPSPWHHH